MCGRASPCLSVVQVEDVIGSRLERPKLEVVGHVKHILLSHIYVDTHGALQKCRVRPTD